GPTSFPPLISSVVRVWTSVSWNFCFSSSSAGSAASAADAPKAIDAKAAKAAIFMESPQYPEAVEMKPLAAPRPGDQTAVHNSALGSLVPGLIAIDRCLDPALHPR